MTEEFIEELTNELIIKQLSEPFNKLKGKAINHQNDQRVKESIDQWPIQRSTDQTAERAFWLAWSQIPSIGPILMRRLHQTFGSLAVAWEADRTALLGIPGLGQVTIDTIITTRQTIEPTRLLSQHLEHNPHFWTPADPEYPHLLREIPDLPPVLYYAGNGSIAADQGQAPMIALVGTRNPSTYGREWTGRISRVLAQAGYTIVSGLATGVDTEAHTSCLKSQGQTIAVLGTGVDVTYPAANRQLAQQIHQHGLLLSEHPQGTPPDRLHFPRRNRIIAGLCRATIVLEAPHKSGALITAHLANDYGRDVYALPGSLNNPRAAGCLKLLSQGAQIILGETELLEVLGQMPQMPVSAIEQLTLAPAAPAPTPNSQLAHLPADLQQVLQAITAEPIAVDRIIERSGLATSQVLGALAQLELLEIVSQLPGMRYQREF